MLTCCDALTHASVTSIEAKYGTPTTQLPARITSTRTLVLYTFRPHPRSSLRPSADIFGCWSSHSDVRISREASLRQADGCPDIAALGIHQHGGRLPDGSLHVAPLRYRPSADVDLARPLIQCAGVRKCGEMSQLASSGPLHLTTFDVFGCDTRNHVCVVHARFRLGRDTYVRPSKDLGV